MRYIIFPVLIVILVQPGSLAQEAARNSDHAELQLNENLKVLKPFLGTWFIDAEIGSKELGDVRPFKAKCVYSVGMDGNFLIAKTYLRGNSNQDHLLHHEFWRWDKQKAKIVSHNFTRDGNHIELEPTLEEKDGKLTVTSIRAEKGSPIPVQQVYQFIDDKSYSWKVLSVTKNPVMDGIWKKQK